MTNKLWLIIKREYITRVRKKSFLLMTILGPIVLGLIMIFPYWLSTDHDVRSQIIVNDASGYGEQIFKEIPHASFFYYNDSATSQFIYDSTQSDVLIHIPKDFMQISSTMKYRSSLNPLMVQLLEEEYKSGILSLMQHTENIRLDKVLDKNSSDQSNSVKSFLSYAGPILIYIFIFTYGIQVMKGVIEEKNNRIIEVMLTTVTPFQMLMGKIFGMALLAFTQFFVWIGTSSLLSYLLYTYFKMDRFLPQNLESSMQVGMNMNVKDVLEWSSFVGALNEINFPLYLLCLTFFLVMGYLIYASLFAIIGSASDVDTETQQFIFPLTVPLLGSLMLLNEVFAQPDSVLTNVLSLVPLTSPLINMAKILQAEHIEYFYLKLLLSMVLLVISFLVFVWLATKIYRVGILTYGSKIGYKDMINWVKGKEE